MTELGSGSIRKMRSELSDVVRYTLPIGDSSVSMNDIIGQQIELTFLNEIRCISCGRRTKKSFSQGHCFPCMKSLASCDGCIVRPETCHYAAGTCREPEWGETHCLIPHTVYLSNTGGTKVGITRGGNEHVRWVDQGATQALPIFTVPERLASGLVEVKLKDHISDKTNWRKMLSGVPDACDLHALRDDLLHRAGDLGGPSPVDADITTIDYPVMRYPDKIKSLDIEKLGSIEGTLEGIKGQYLMLDVGVINVRKYTGYIWRISAR